MRVMNGGCVDIVNANGCSMWRRLISRENLYAVLICLMVIAILILTSDQAPAWIYQGF